MWPCAAHRPWGGRLSDLGPPPHCWTGSLSAEEWPLILLCFCLLFFKREVQSNQTISPPQTPQSQAGKLLSWVGPTLHILLCVIVVTLSCTVSGTGQIYWKSKCTANERCPRLLVVLLFITSDSQQLCVSFRLLRRRPDVRPEDTALRHTRQLLPRQYDPAQGQPGGPHHPLAHPALWHTLPSDPTPPSPQPLGLTEHHPCTRWDGGDRDQLFFYRWTLLVGVHFTWNSSASVAPQTPPPSSEAARTDGDINTRTTTSLHLSSITRLPEVCVCVCECVCVFCLFFFSLEHPPPFFLSDEDFLERTKPLSTLPNITFVYFFLKSWLNFFFPETFRPKKEDLPTVFSFPVFFFSTVYQTQMMSSHSLVLIWLRTGWLDYEREDHLPLLYKLHLFILWLHSPHIICKTLGHIWPYVSFHSDDWSARHSATRAHCLWRRQLFKSKTKSTFSI